MRGTRGRALARALVALDSAAAACAARSDVSAELCSTLAAFALQGASAARALHMVVERAARAAPPPPQAVAAVYAAWKAVTHTACAALRAAAPFLSTPSESAIKLAAAASMLMEGAGRSAASPALQGGEAAARRTFGADALRPLVTVAQPWLVQGIDAEWRGEPGPDSVNESAEVWRYCAQAAAGTFGIAEADAGSQERAAAELARDAPGVLVGLFEFAAAVARRAAVACSAARADELEETAGALSGALRGPAVLAARLRSAPQWRAWAAARCAALAAPGLRALGARATPADPAWMAAALEIAEELGAVESLASVPSAGAAALAAAERAPSGTLDIAATTALWRAITALWLDGALDLAAALGTGLAKAFGEPRLEVLTARAAAPVVVPAAWAPGAQLPPAIDVPAGLGMRALHAAAARAAVVEGCGRLPPGYGNAALKPAAELLRDAAKLAGAELKSGPRGPAAERALSDAATVVAQLAARGAAARRASPGPHAFNAAKGLVSCLGPAVEPAHDVVGRRAVAVACVAAARAALRGTDGQAQLGVCQALLTAASTCGAAAVHAAGGVELFSEHILAALGEADASEAGAGYTRLLLAISDAVLRIEGGTVDIMTAFVASGAAAAAARYTAAGRSGGRRALVAGLHGRRLRRRAHAGVLLGLERRRLGRTLRARA